MSALSVLAASPRRLPGAGPASSRRARGARFTAGVTLLVAVLSAGLAVRAPARAAPARVDGGIRFSYSDPNAGSVSWAGAFNGWSTTANPMSKDASGVWSIVLALPAGEHEYKFVVDGQYLADPENGVTRGDFGNSLVGIDANGELITAQATSNTPYSPKIFLGGRVIGLYQFIRNAATRRFELRRPDNDIDLRFDIRISDLLKARFVTNINSEAQGGDFFRSSLAFDRGSLEFVQPRLQLFGYDNEDAGTWDDPLRLVGGIGIYEHGFGYGHQGFRVRAQRWGLDAEAQYSDNFETGGTIYPGFAFDPGIELFQSIPTVPSGGGYALHPGDFASATVFSRSDGNENTFALRARRELTHGLRVGFLGRNDRGFDLGTIDHLEVTGPTTLREVYGTAQRQWLAGGGEVAWQGPRRFTFFGEYLRGEERLVPVSASQVSWRVDSADASGIVEAFGTGTSATGRHLVLDTSDRFRLGGTWTEAHGDIAVTADVEYQDHSYSIFHDGLENSMTIWSLDWERNWRYYVGREVKTQLDFEYSNFDYDPATPWSHQFWIPTGNFWLEHGEHKIRVDRLVMLGGNDVITIRPSVEVPVLRKRNVRFRWDGLFNTVKLGTTPKYAESIFKLGVDLNSATRLSTDTRWVKYDDPLLHLDDGYVDHFFQVAHRFAPTIELALSFGVDPYVIDAPVNEYAYVGRDQFLFERGANGTQAEVDYYGLGARIAAAEKALRDERRIQLKATVQF